MKKEKMIAYRLTTSNHQGQENYIKTFMLCLTWAYIILIPLFVLINSINRGYFAIGGEAFGWIIPMIIYMELEEDV